MSSMVYMHEKSLGIEGYVEKLQEMVTFYLQVYVFL